MSKAVIRAQTVFFRRMGEGIETNYALLQKLEQSLISALPQGIVSALETLEYSLSGCQGSRVSHSLKTVALAEQESVNIELIIALLIHYIDDHLTLEKHSQMAATTIRLYFNKEVTCVLQMHGVFLMYCFADKIGQNACERERWREHQWFASCGRFRRAWDKASFDPAFDSKTLTDFTPMINEIFSRVAFVPHVISRDYSGLQVERL